MVTKDFVAAGKAIFTVDNGKGTHYTFRAKTGKPNDRYPVPATFLQLLTGPDNTADFTYLGILVPETGAVKLTAASKMGDDAQPVKVARWALAKLWKGEEFPDGYQVRHEGKCGRCGRRLTHPDSLTSGIGPECEGRINGGK